MNVILLLVDSLNRHHLQPYGCDFVRTPNLQAFADCGIVMDRHFAGSLPCMPARREIFAGMREFPWRGWGHIEAFDTPLPDYARRLGYTTQLITDHYHYIEHPAHGYVESFNGYELIRGQEIDCWKTQPVKSAPDWAERMNEFRPGCGTRYYRNTMDFRKEDDWFTPRVFNTAQEWLERNGEQPFFLFIDHFEVHEPFYCIEPYRSLYTDDPGIGHDFWPPYQDDEARARFFEQTSEAELAYIRSQYYGKVTWVDAYLGRLMEKMDQLGLWENTAVLITTDHGHDLAEWRPNFGKQPPHHDSHAHLPLLIRHPEIAGGSRRSAITSTIDLHATVREILGEESPQSPNSRSFLPMLKDESASHRAATICGTYGTGAMVADQDLTYVHQPEGDSRELNWYSSYFPLYTAPERAAAATSGSFLTKTQFPVWKIPNNGAAAPQASDHRLYRHAATDPSGQPNIITREAEQAARMKRLLIQTLTEDSCPPEQLRRLGLSH